MDIDEIKALLKSGDIAGAEAAAQELLTAEPDNVQAMMFYGTCRQLQGDEATFRRIHVELEPKIAKIADEDVRRMWRKYDMIRDWDNDMKKLKVSNRNLSSSRPVPVYGCPPFRRTGGCGCVLLIGMLLLTIVIWRLCVK